MIERVIESSSISSMTAANCGRRDGGQIGPDGVADRIEEIGQLPQQAAVARDRIAQGDDDLLLPERPREVALAGRLAGARVGKGVAPIEMVQPGRDRPAPSLEAVAVVRRVIEGLLDIDIDAADRIDHPDEAAELQLGIVVDVDPEQGADRVLERRHPAVGKLLGMFVGIRHQGVELGTEGVAVPERHVDEVARDGQHRDRVPDRVDRDHHHRVGEDRGPQTRRVDTDEQDVDPLVERRTGVHVRAALVLEHLRKGITERTSRTGRRAHAGSRRGS